MQREWDKKPVRKFVAQRLCFLSIDLVDHRKRVCRNNLQGWMLAVNPFTRPTTLNLAMRISITVIKRDDLLSDVADFTASTASATLVIKTGVSPAAPTAVPSLIPTVISTVISAMPAAVTTVFPKTAMVAAGMAPVVNVVKWRKKAIGNGKGKFRCLRRGGGGPDGQRDGKSGGDTQCEFLEHVIVSCCRAVGAAPLEHGETIGFWG